MVKHIFALFFFSFFLFCLFIFYIPCLVPSGQHNLFLVLRHIAEPQVIIPNSIRQIAVEIQAFREVIPTYE